MLFVPTTEQMERNYAGRLRVKRLDVTDPEGVAAQKQYGQQLVPAFILLDTAGQKRWRGRLPPKANDLHVVGL